jgi:glucan phosphoethanolaminetransferase (alkaline phosphatase superfamily)
VRAGLRVGGRAPLGFSVTNWKQSSLASRLPGSAAVQGVHDVQGTTTERTRSEPAVVPSPPPGPPRARRWLRLLVSRRRYIGAGALAFLPLLVVLLDLGRRSDRIFEFEDQYRFTYLFALAESAILWGTLLYAASARRGAYREVCAFLLVVFATFTIGGQSYFFQQYNAYLNVDVSVFASNFKESVVNQLFADIGNYLQAKLPVLLAALALVWIGRRAIRARGLTLRGAQVFAPLFLFASFFIPTQHRHVQASTPDVLYLNAIGGLIRTQTGLTEQSNQLRPRLRESLPVPPLVRATATPKRNVLFVILESVRASATCIEHDEDCRLTEHTNQLFPKRYPFQRMRSVDSCTAISLAVLWSGLYPTESRDTLHTWPLLFDYAKAAGYDTAFWTSQNMMFGNVRLWVKNLGARKFVSATDLDPTADLDMGAPENLLADHVNAELGDLKEPYFAVVQLSNVHYPYYVDPSGPEPFQPATTSKAPDENTAFLNYYQNSVYQQDQHVARILEHLRSTPAGARTVIVYTSDHGEAFREHGQMGHTFSIFDEETHVPMWIDAPPGTLTEAEAATLTKKSNDYLFHIDLAPTVLDLMGVLDDPGIAEYRTRMHGHSLLRPELSEQPIPMTNCAGVWSCAFENWGYMQKNMKLEARSWDSGWNCYDLDADPGERDKVDLARCQGLLQAANHTYGRLPGQGVERKDQLSELDRAKRWLGGKLGWDLSKEE